MKDLYVQLRNRKKKKHIYTMERGTVLWYICKKNTKSQKKGEMAMDFKGHLKKEKKGLVVAAEQQAGR